MGGRGAAIYLKDLLPGNNLYPIGYSPAGDRCRILRGRLNGTSRAGTSDRIEWKSGEDDANYRIIALPNRPCTIRANAPDITTGIFHRSAGAKRIMPGSQSRAATLP